LTRPVLSESRTTDSIHAAPPPPRKRCPIPQGPHAGVSVLLWSMLERSTHSFLPFSCSRAACRPGSSERCNSPRQTTIILISPAAQTAGSAPNHARSFRLPSQIWRSTPSHPKPAPYKNNAQRKRSDRCRLDYPPHQSNPDPHQPSLNHHI